MLERPWGLNLQLSTDNPAAKSQLFGNKEKKSRLVKEIELQGQPFRRSTSRAMKKPNFRLLYKHFYLVPA